MSKAAELVEQSVHETLTYYAFPDIHWQKIRTNNPLERIMRESPPPNTRRRRISGRPVLSHSGCCPGCVTSRARHGQPSAT